jgi:hypothetical protein
MADQVDVPFPLGGIDVAGEFGAQREGTTPFAQNVRATDPILERDRGGSRHGLARYPNRIPAGATLVQGLGQLVIQDYDYLLTTFEDFEPDFIADPSTNNTSTRNPGRSIPPSGSGVPPNRHRPDDPRRRVALVPSSTSLVNGATLTLTATLTRETGSTVVAGQTLSLLTNPPGLDGEGDTAVTNVSGVATFTVSESTYAGLVRYLAVHEYTPPI